MEKTRCDWCKKSSSNLKEHTDAFKNTSLICDKCFNTVNSHKCRKCKSLIDAMFEAQGLCMNCYQAELYKINKKKEAVRIGVDADLAADLVSDLDFSDKDYEQWVTMGRAYSSEDARNCDELRRMWIMVKLNSTGLYDQATILKNFKDIETLLDRNFSKLINQKCKIIIGNSSTTRALIRQASVLDMENQVVIAIS